MSLKLLLCPLAFLIELLGTLLVPIPIIIFGFLRALIPVASAQTMLTHFVEQSALLWTDINYFILKNLLKLEITVIGREQLTPGKNYFVIANHQSWIDILMLEDALYRMTGFSRYFIKKNLLHIPLSGWACRMLHYPSMHRFSKEHLAKHPEDQGKDALITKRACQKLRGFPFKLNSFPEGTRFTTSKHHKQASPYQYLLKPKSGGIAYAVQALHDQLDCFVNMTIIYHEKPNVMKLFFGGMTKVTIVLEKIPITPDLIGDYENDPMFKKHFQDFVTKIWQKKDQLIKNYQSRDC